MIIKINLLPEGLRPIKRTPLPHLASLLVLALALAAMGYVFMEVRGRVAGEEQRLAAIERELKELEPIREDYKRLKAEEQTLRAKVEVIDEILRDRIVWSEQLDRLVTLTPENVWYDRVWVAMEADQREVVVVDEKTKEPVIDPRTNRPKVEIIKTNEQRLFVSGYVKADENMRFNVNPLLNNTRADTAFAAVFPQRNPRFEDTVFAERPVRRFTLVFGINAGGGA
ncbi:MAG TPA: hypothetical protein PKI11_01250 [Candidatus Hydrogenedentes bacterium]|nr:hypothetical protein [Candidatus Hydrogenedentota bacterium]HNT87269.1 hypothetical protein [Candidatus Hydrogenedentota bacterium]